MSRPARPSDKCAGCDRSLPRRRSCRRRRRSAGSWYLVVMNSVFGLLPAVRKRFERTSRARPPLKSRSAGGLLPRPRAPLIQIVADASPRRQQHADEQDYPARFHDAFQTSSFRKRELGNEARDLAGEGTNPPASPRRPEHPRTIERDDILLAVPGSANRTPATICCPGPDGHHPPARICPPDFL